MSWVLGKQFILIHQFEASVSVVPRQKVQGRFEQIAVLGSVVQFLVLASPDQRTCPVAVPQLSAWQRPVVLERGRLPAAHCWDRALRDAAEIPCSIERSSCRLGA